MSHSRDSILDAIKSQLAKDPRLTLDDFALATGISTKAVTRVGGWIRLKAEAGVTLRGRRQPIAAHTLESLTQKLRDLAAASIGHSAFANICGSFRNLQALSGVLDTNRAARAAARQKFRDEMVTAAARLLNTHGSRLTRRVFQELSGYSHDQVGAAGGWLAIKLAAGFDNSRGRMSPRRELTLEDLLVRLHELVSENDDRITLSQFCHLSRIAPATVYRLFGSWNRLRMLAGLVPNVRGRAKYPTESLLADVYRVHQIVKMIPVPREYRKYGAVDIGTLMRRFRTWYHLTDRYREFWKRVREITDPLERETFIDERLRYLYLTQSHPHALPPNPQANN